jgi:tRNA(Ile)-lysidine synthase TilS/MesJ
MVQGTNFPPISQEKGVKKNMLFCNQLKMKTKKNKKQVSLKLTTINKKFKTLTDTPSACKICSKYQKHILSSKNLRLSRTEEDNPDDGM